MRGTASAIPAPKAACGRQHDQSRFWTFALDRFPKRKSVTLPFWKSLTLPFWKCRIEIRDKQGKDRTRRTLIVRTAERTRTDSGPEVDDPVTGEGAGGGCSPLPHLRGYRRGQKAATAFLRGAPAPCSVGPAISPPGPRAPGPVRRSPPAKKEPRAARPAGSSHVMSPKSPAEV